MKGFTSHRGLRFNLVAVLAVVVTALLSIPSAQAATPSTGDTTGFVPFRAFLAGLGDSTYPSVAKSDASLAQTAAEFAQTKSYLEHLYKGVAVRTSFITDGSYFDCVTETTQPTANALGIKRIAQPPPRSVSTLGAATAPWTTRGVDQTGRIISCPSGTVPMRRITLQEVANCCSLHDFVLAKDHPNKLSTDVPNYRHAYGYEFVHNDGASSVINVWNPDVPTSSQGDDHSLSQQWVIGGSGSETQTAEAGWTKDLRSFSATDPVYFVYFTANDYVSTGCYNLECTGFVQTNNKVALGAPVSPCCSTKGKVNDAYTQQYYLYKHRWWLSINGTYIGYYPVSVYDGGQMSKYSTLVEYGGEVNGEAKNVNWPQMGSGAFASAGLKKAAYQSSIEYINLKSKYEWADLTTLVTGGGSTPSPCYSITYTAAMGKTGPFFYYGGPGGKQGTC